MAFRQITHNLKDVKNLSPFPEVYWERTDERDESGFDACVRSTFTVYICTIPHRHEKSVHYWICVFVFLLCTVCENRHTGKLAPCAVSLRFTARSPFTCAIWVSTNPRKRLKSMIVMPDHQRSSIKANTGHHHHHGMIFVLRWLVYFFVWSQLMWSVCPDSSVLGLIAYRHNTST